MSRMKRGKEGQWLKAKLAETLVGPFGWTGFGLGALDFSASADVIVVFQPEWLPCGVAWLSTGLGGMMHFVQGSG
jgi:hypothetical protein